MARAREVSVDVLRRSFETSLGLGPTCPIRCGVLLKRARVGLKQGRQLRANRGKDCVKAGANGPPLSKGSLWIDTGGAQHIALPRRQLSQNGNIRLKRVDHSCELRPDIQRGGVTGAALRPGRIGRDKQRCDYAVSKTTAQHGTLGGQPPPPDPLPSFSTNKSVTTSRWLKRPVVELTSSATTRAISA